MARYAYFEGRVVDLEDARISVMTHAFNYGTACFEGIRAYWNEERRQLYLFRVREHYQRMLNSAKILRIRSALTLDQLVEVTLEILRRNGDREDVYVRPLFYKSERAIGVRLHGLSDDFTLFAVPFGPYLDVEKPIRARVSSWRHVGDNVIPMRAKISGSYVNAALAKSEAAEDGYDEAIFLTEDGHVSEGSAENLFLVRNGRLITTPVYADILEGITRATILQLATEQLHLPVEERPIDRTELYVADEVFLVGTGAQVSAVGEIDHRPVGDGAMGPITRRIQRLYFEVVKGNVPEYRHWLTPVYQEGK
ncbi:branched-chain amino acid transaminase [Carboxydochorda subterranea]|uniref:Branched-chain-amino-acid aminotransferase n=1 Tax=Carboxydichorda subterranea TaxID=3109565 RepID=A0ABZ1BWE8_9FIRM|nr:branched-chain amino acid transaminase [Limnochorda sp. L945t]WRP17102.1 branched-chain amino acid transaminase [Limnochorda sp. L945t]